MANKRVTDLPQAEKMLDGDILHIIQNGTDKQIPANKVGGGGVKQGTRAEIDAMILSGEIEEGDSYIVNDEDGVYQPADLEDIRKGVVHYYDLTLRDFSLDHKASGDGVYYSSSSYNPITGGHLPSNAEIIGVTLLSWSTTTSAPTPFVVNGNAVNFMANVSTTLRAPKVRFLYVLK